MIGSEIVPLHCALHDTEILSLLGDAGFWASHRGVAACSRGGRGASQRITPDALLQTLAVRQQARITRILRSGPDTDAAIDAVKDTVQELARFEARSLDRAERACGANCSACCHQTLLVLLPEALWIARELQARSSPGELEAIEEQITRVAGRVVRMTPVERAAARIPCVLLDAVGNCGLYAVRPLRCRSWTSFSRAACEASLEHPRRPRWAAFDRVAFSVGCALTDGFQHALHACGMNPELYEIHTAVGYCLRGERTGEGVRLSK